MTMKKFGLVGLGLLVLGVFGGVAVAGVAGPSRQMMGGVGSHGLLAPLSDQELTAAADNVVVGTVVSSELVPLSADPDLPQPLSAAGQELLDGGFAHLKWHVRVNNWVKGTGPQDIIVVQAHGGESAAGASHVSIEDPAIETLGALGHDAIQPGQTYSFWIDKYDWFKKNYYVLARGKLPTP
jgi:hypothetical protein